MRIGLVRRGYSGTGGAEAYLRRFAGAAAAGGDECVLFASREWAGQEWPFGERRLLDGRSPRAFADALQEAEPKAACDVLFSLERVWSCDCYRAGDGVHAAWLRRRERRENALASWFRRLRAKHRELLALERRLFTPGATRLVIANSELVREEIVREFGYPAERVRVIYNGVPARTAREPEQRRAAREGLGLREGDYVALFAGSGWERKGLRFAIEAVNAAQLPNLTLLVAGRGEPRGLPVSDRTRFLGPVRGMEGVLAAADVFLLPTLYDPFSNACLEAAAAGLPVITTADNGFSEIIAPGKEGEVLRDPADTGALAAALRRWADPVRRAAARPRVEELGRRFGVEANVKATLDALRSLPPLSG